MIKHSFTIGATAALAITLFSGLGSDALAQFGNLGDIVEREVERTVRKETRRALDSATTSGDDAIRTRTLVANAGGAPKPVEITQCDPSLRPSRIVYGRLGEYTFQQGMSTERRTGFIDRREVSFESGCVLPNLQSGEIVYLEFDTDRLRAAGHPNAYETQCIKIDDRAYGELGETEGRGEYPTNDSYLGEAHLRLACGNSEGISECTNGRNADRATAADQDLKARGVTALSFHMMRTRRGTTPREGERLYCQYYNTTSGRSLFAYEYHREYG